MTVPSTPSLTLFFSFDLFSPQGIRKSAVLPNKLIRPEECLGIMRVIPSSLPARLAVVYHALPLHEAP